MDGCRDHSNREACRDVLWLEERSHFCAWSGEPEDFPACYNSYIQVRYEWDEVKNRLNLRKHGVLFEVAALVFEDEHCLVRLDRTDDRGEQRWHAIGAVCPQGVMPTVLFVVHVYREEINGKEIIRIISARRANQNEVRRYQEQEIDRGGVTFPSTSRCQAVRRRRFRHQLR